MVLDGLGACATSSFISSPLSSSTCSWGFWQLWDVNVSVTHKKWVEEEELVCGAFLLSDWRNGPDWELSQFLQASPKLMMTRWPWCCNAPPPKETATHEGCFFLPQPQKKWCCLSTQMKNHVLTKVPDDWQDFWMLHSFLHLSKLQTSIFSSILLKDRSAF